MENVRQVAYTVGTTPIQICEELERCFLYFGNETAAGAEKITIVFGNTPAVSGVGITLAAGAKFMESDSENYKVFRGKVFAVASAAGQSLAVVER